VHTFILADRFHGISAAAMMIETSDVTYPVESICKNECVHSPKASLSFHVGPDQQEDLGADTQDQVKVVLLESSSEVDQGRPSDMQKDHVGA
jgi:hypothetical protein